MQPRFVTLSDDVQTHRVNLGHVQRWRPDMGDLVVTFEQGEDLRMPDPEGALDRRLCAAFFDVTPIEIG